MARDFADEKNGGLRRLRGLSGDVSTAHAMRRFLGEAFTQESIYYKLGVNLMTGWCGLNDGAALPSLPAGILPGTFGRYRHGADVAINRGGVRHDLLPKQTRRPGSKRASAREVPQLDQRTLYLST